MIELRLHAGVRSPGDLTLNVQEKTYDYLMNSDKAEVRVSAYLDRDWPRVETMYSELFVNDACPYRFQVTRITPGSKVRWTITLPDEMKDGEQVVIFVNRLVSGQGG